MSLNLSKIIKSEYNKALKEVNNDIKKVATTIHESLVLSTPVDTSKALSNWQVGINKKPKTIKKPFFEGSKGSTFDQSSDKTMRIGASKISRKKIKDEVIISNSVDYIVDLDNGKSKQNSNFVNESIMLGLEEI